MSGDFAKLNEAQKKEAKAFINKAHSKGKLPKAAAANPSQKTIFSEGGFRLERRQAVPNDGGARKVAVEQNGPRNGRSTTVAQTKVLPGYPTDSVPPSGKIRNRLQASLKFGKETYIKPQRRLDHDRRVAEGQQQKRETLLKKHNEGIMARAAAGNTRKGKT
ncbi:hypothetical protein CC1G_14287 [Coprinopsis cinerea okayama7|uniref:Uncharacterized protein n=1 Tax=Coprinopsis cinerea (strain Okayama-7 / 130 / ATCC MYA-4618 / FGSC 9003) TaxID=240176 RepID=D6RLG9_COPC7|nr:hypothetical protein CC1G_14287 [Coprinopsis cinerea okayama7\|eukprot:XP_002911757.1 hypothetical protein CC1G_14287 [Coprinopsis cinerea okayama7\